MNILINVLSMLLLFTYWIAYSIGLMCYGLDSWSPMIMGGLCWVINISILQTAMLSNGDGWLHR